MLNPESLPALQRALVDASLDGWLLFDFQGTNPIASGMLRVEGLSSRRIFAWIPATGVPHALGHAIEAGPLRHWPLEWTRSTYSSWQTLERGVGEMVSGKRIAMEYSSGDAVPYLDRVPGGVLEMIRTAGAKAIVSSGELVTQFYASWSERDIQSHVRAAEIIATIARQALGLAGERSRTSSPATEHEIMVWIQEASPEQASPPTTGPT